MNLSKLALMTVLSRADQIERDASTQARVDSRINQRKCLNKMLTAVGSDEYVDCDGAMSSMGLCDKCKSAYYRRRNNGSEVEQLNFQADLIRAGLLLAPGELQRRKQRSLLAIHGQVAS